MNTAVSLLYLLGMDESLITSTEAPTEAPSEVAGQREIQIAPSDHVDYQRMKVAEVLGEDSLSYKKYERELTALVAWAKDSGAITNEDIVWEVRNLANRLGSSTGENKIKFLYRYAYLTGERKSIDRELKRFEYGNTK